MSKTILLAEDEATLAMNEARMLKLFFIARSFPIFPVLFCKLRIISQ